MGNGVGWLANGGGLDGLCSGRGFPAFLPPNTEHVTYSWNYIGVQEINLSNNVKEPTTGSGFEICPQVAEWRPPRLYVVKEYAPNPMQLKLQASGRFHIHCLGAPLAATGVAEACAFRICTRGRPIYETLRTRTFTHTAHVITSGVFFALYVTQMANGLFLCPRIILVLENGDQVVLVDDKLGPLPPPAPFYVDFAILDEGGRNIQIDMIFRGLPPASPNLGARTLRTCLQEYTTFNSHVQNASISVGGSADLSGLLLGANVYLQDLVVSEHALEEAVPLPQPYDMWKEAAMGKRGERFNMASKVLFEGQDARVASMAIDVPEAPLAHPQLQEDFGARGGSAGQEATLLKESSSTEDFWYHIRYDEEGNPSDPPGIPEYMMRIRGEFWLSRHAVDKKDVYFHCSSTLAQALTTCIIFRFSCPTDYLTLIESQAAYVLRDTHIPTNGVVLGVERDPRHNSLFRMFVEHRNEILDDMVVCECPASDLMRSIVHQEVYDAGSSITYRLTILHRDGQRQSASLQMSTDRFEDSALADTSRCSSYRLVEEPSLRFPISPCFVRQNLSPANRIFVYSSAVYEPPAPPLLEGRPGEEDGDYDEMQSLATWTPDGATSSRAPDWSMMSEATMEDWQSAGAVSEHGDCPDHLDPGKPRKGPQGSLAQDTVEWRRPMVESVVLLRNVEEPPFKCFPRPLAA